MANRIPPLDSRHDPQRYGEHMAVWDELKIQLAALQQRDPLPLTMYPSPESDQDRQPPIEIGLAAWATPVAEQLHDRFGDELALTVGAMRYSQRTVARDPAGLVRILPPALDPGLATIAWATPLRVRSGHTAHHDMTITNVGAEQIDANGPLIADIVDPDSGETVGGTPARSAWRSSWWPSHRVRPRGLRC